MKREEALRIIKECKEKGFKHTFYTLNEYHTALDIAIKALEQEPCGDAIIRKSIKQKLQEHHDFFVNAYGGFSNLPPNDKSRVDEITNCIAMVVNEPSVNPQPKTGRWIADVDRWGDIVTTVNGYRCSECNAFNTDKDNYCPNCGAKMIEPQERSGEE